MERGTEDMHRMFTTVFRPDQFPKFVTRVQGGWSPGALDLSKPEDLQRDRDLQDLNGQRGALSVDVNVDSSSSEVTFFAFFRSSARVQLYLVSHW